MPLNKTVRFTGGTSDLFIENIKKRFVPDCFNADSDSDVIHLNRFNKLIKHIPYLCSTAAVICAVIFAIKGDAKIAGIFLVVSGLLYLIFSEKVLATTSEVEKKYPPLKLLSKLMGGSTLRAIKIGGGALLIVGILWIFYV